MATRKDEDDFDAAWAHYRARNKPITTKRILGVDVEVPTDVPMIFEDKFNELKDSKKPEHFEELLVMLFGEGTYGKWKANGLTGAQLRILTTWGVVNAGGTPTTFAEAVDLVEEVEAAEAAGKARTVPNRADRRRASSKTPTSAKVGNTSSRTSAASTASRSKKSPS